MSKWKCGICNSEFDNFQAQGFGETIYCPLCYFKELYRRTKLEIDRLNNIINKAIEYIENEKNKQTSVGVYTKDIHKNLLKILKGDE